MRLLFILAVIILIQASTNRTCGDPYVAGDPVEIKTEYALASDKSSRVWKSGISCHSVTADKRFLKYKKTASEVTDGDVTTTKSTCEDKMADGAACSSDDQCSSSYCDIAVTHLCVKTPLALTATCTMDYQCASLFCEGGVCATPIADGGVCTQGLEEPCAPFGTCLKNPVNTAQLLCYYDYTLAPGQPLPEDDGDGKKAYTCTTQEYYQESNSVLKCADESILKRVDTHGGDYTRAWSKFDCTVIYTSGKRSKRRVTVEVDPMMKKYYNESNEDTMMYCPFSGTEKIFTNYTDQYRAALKSGDYWTAKFFHDLYYGTSLADGDSPLNDYIDPIPCSQEYEFADMYKIRLKASGGKIMMGAMLLVLGLLLI